MFYIVKDGQIVGESSNNEATLPDSSWSYVVHTGVPVDEAVITEEGVISRPKQMKDNHHISTAVKASLLDDPYVQSLIAKDEAVSTKEVLDFVLWMALIANGDNKANSIKDGSYRSGNKPK